MSKLAELRSQAELPHWLEPLALEIARPIQEDLRANTRALEQVNSQLRDLIEVQLTFLEATDPQRIRTVLANFRGAPRALVDGIQLGGIGRKLSLKRKKFLPHCLPGCCGHGLVKARREVCEVGYALLELLSSQPLLGNEINK